MELLEKLYQFSTLLTFVFSIAATAVGAYITIRLAPIVRRLSSLSKECAELKEENKKLRVEVQEAAKDIRVEAKLATEKTEEKFSDALSSLSGELGELAEALPNCEAHRAEFNGQLATMKAELKAELTSRTGEIAESNRKFRDEIIQRSYDSRDQITREILNRDAVQNMVEKESRSVEQRHINGIYERLSKLESKK